MARQTSVWAGLLVGLLWSPAWAERPTLAQVLACQRTLSSPVADQYRPDNGNFLCDSTSKECFLAFKDGETFRLALPDKPSFAVREIMFDMSDVRQPIEHRLLGFTEPRSGKKIAIDVFWGENRRAYARTLLKSDLRSFQTLKSSKANTDLLWKLAQRRVDVLMELVKVNVASHSGPPGWTLERNKTSWLERVSGCDYSPATAEIKKAVHEMKASL